MRGFIMKKNVLVLVAAVCMAAALTACGSSNSTAETTAAAAETTTADTAAGSTDTAADTAADTSAAEETEGAGGKIVMVTNAEFPPYEYHENNTIVGIDADIAQAICDKLGYELEIDDMEFDAILAAVQSGKADFGAAGMTVTEDRLESVDFTDTYANASQVIIVKAD